MSYCCTHAHKGCGPVTTTSVVYDCNIDYTECWDCLLRRWSQKKLSFCCATAHKGCGPVNKEAAASTNDATNTPHPQTGKIVGGVLGGMAGATALGLLGGMFAHHLNETKTMREKLRHETRVVEQATNISHAAAVAAQAAVKPSISPSALTGEQGSSGSLGGSSGSMGGSSGDPLLALIPLLLLLAGLCGALFWFLKGNKAKKKGRRHAADDDISESSDAAMLLESESTAGSGSQFVSYDAGQSQYVQGSDFSRASSAYGGASSAASVASSSPLIGSITPPRVKASLSQPKLVGWVNPNQQASTGSFVVEGASASMSAAGSVSGASVSIAPTLAPASMLQVGEQQMIETVTLPVQQMVGTSTQSVQLVPAGGAITPPAPLMPMGMMFR